MNSVYESLRALLRTKELEIKKLEKEIEALRVVLPIVAEAGNTAVEHEPPASSPKFTAETVAKAKPYTAAEFENVMAQAAAASAGTGNIPAPDLTPKPRTNWP